MDKEVLEKYRKLCDTRSKEELVDIVARTLEALEYLLNSKEKVNSINRELIEASKQLTNQIIWRLNLKSYTT